jgi:VanZ family protein
LGTRHLLSVDRRVWPSFTERVLTGALGLFHLTLSKAGFEVFHFCVRKAAHLAEYAVFAALLCASSKEPQFPWRPRRVLGCFLVAVVYSLMDEYHQSFVPGRHASFADCGIDSIGAALGILAYSANHLRLRTVGLCTTGILPGSTDARTCPDDFGRDVDATIPSGGERRTRQNDRIAPMPGRDDA